MLEYPILWLLRDLAPAVTVQFEFADPAILRPDRRTILPRVEQALRLFPGTNLLLVHRDSETEQRELRVAEIRSAMERVSPPIDTPFVCVIPVRMTETWLLTDEAAIRQAAGNPNGRTPLQIPQVQQLEQDTNPKATLEDNIRLASELTGRRLKKLRFPDTRQRVGQLTRSFNRLRLLSAFAAFENDLRETLRRLELV